jgi:hypothetical protein
MLFVSGSYQNYQNGAVINQLTDFEWRGGGGVWLKLRDEGGFKKYK